MASILTKRLLSSFQSQLQQQFLTMRRSWLRSGLLLRDDLVGQSSTTMSIIILIFVLCHMPRLGKQRNAVLTTRFHLIGVLCFPGKLANSQGFTSGTLGNTWNLRKIGNIVEIRFYLKPILANSESQKVWRRCQFDFVDFSPKNCPITLISKFRAQQCFLRCDTLDF